MVGDAAVQSIYTRVGVALSWFEVLQARVSSLSSHRQPMGRTHWHYVDPCLGQRWLRRYTCANQSAGVKTQRITYAGTVVNTTENGHDT